MDVLAVRCFLKEIRLASWAEVVLVSKPLASRLGRGFE